MPENTTAKPKPVLDVPDITLVKAPPPRECTMDKAVDSLPVGALKNALMWEYTKRGDTRAPTLTQAIGSMEIRGIARNETSVGNLITRYWRLHSKYVAPTCREIRETYTDILTHVVSLQTQFGDAFLERDSRETKELVERLAGETGPPDEYEKNRAESYSLFANADGTPYQLEPIVQSFLTKLGELPESEGEFADRVNIDSAVYHFRDEGVIGYCIKLIGDFLQDARDREYTEEVLDFDLNNQTNYTRFPSCILLGSQCNLHPQPVTNLHADWYADMRVIALNNPSIPGNENTRHDVTGLFIYSDVDAALTTLLDNQKGRMNFHDKTAESYDWVMNEHRHGWEGWPPWRTMGGAWPEDSTMENTNYTSLEAMLGTVIVAEPRRKGGGSKRFREPAEDDRVPPKPPVKKKKVRKEPAEEVVVAQEEVETDDTNYALWGGLAAITAGVTVIALSRRGVRSR